MIDALGAAGPGPGKCNLPLFPTSLTVTVIVLFFLQTDANNDHPQPKVSTMFQSRPKLSLATLASLTDDQIKRLYKQRLVRWTRSAGFGTNITGYLESGGATFEEFYQDFRNGKICVVLASELPEVYAEEQAGVVAEYVGGASQVMREARA